MRPGRKTCRPGEVKEAKPMTATPLMPKATAVWLVDNTALSFDQIAAFCKLHPLEVGAIADGEAAYTIKGLDPILTGQLTRDEITKAEGNPEHRLALSAQKTRVPETKRRGPRYTPVSRRQDRPNAILWLLRFHAELKDSQIMRLVGTTKPTIEAIRNRSHWNANNLQPVDPVALGLCSQIDLDFEVEKAAKDAPPRPDEPTEGATLLSAAETTTVAGAAAAAAAEAAAKSAAESERIAGVRAGADNEREADLEADAVFAKLQSLKGPEKTDSDS
jgi:hypothetical protein